MNCIWIMTDSFRQDHVHAYRPAGTIDDTGPALQVHTPNLDKLAGQSVMFDHMLAESLPTIPCRRAIFTGRRTYPWRRDSAYKGDTVRAPGWCPLPLDDVTVAEHLSEHGYVTALVADTYHIMKPAMNFHRGFQSFHWERGQEFDHWHTQPLPAGCLEQYLKPDLPLEPRRTLILSQYLKNQMFVCGDDDYPAARTFRWAMQWLERNHAHENFFLYIDTFSPHEPWLTPQRFLDLYDPKWKGPKLIYGNPYKRSQLTDAEHQHLRARYDGRLYNTDLTATVLSLLGAPPKPDVEGKNVWPAVTTRSVFRGHLVTAYTNTIGVWKDHWLYLKNAASNTAALYNLAEDVHRKHDVSSRYPDVCCELAEKEKEL